MKEGFTISFVFKAIILCIIAFLLLTGIKYLFFDDRSLETIKNDLKESRDSLRILDSLYKIKEVRVKSLEKTIAHKDSIIANRKKSIEIIYREYEKEISVVQSLDLVNTIELLSNNLSKTDSLR